MGMTCPGLLKCAGSAVGSARCRTVSIRSEPEMPVVVPSSLSCEVFNGASVSEFQGFRLRVNVHPELIACFESFWGLRLGFGVWVREVGFGVQILEFGDFKVGGSIIIRVLGYYGIRVSGFWGIRVSGC